MFKRKIDEVSPATLSRVKDTMILAQSPSYIHAVDPVKGLGEIVSGAALVMQRNAPHAVHVTAPTTADDWFNSRSDEGLAMQEAAGLAVQRLEAGDIPGKDLTNRLMTHIVSDLMIRSQALSMAMGANYTDQMDKLDSPYRERAQKAVEDPSLKTEFDKEMTGRYHELDRAGQHRIAKVLIDGDNLSPEMKADIADMARLIDQEIRDVAPRMRAVDSRLADFSDYGTPLFAEIDYDHITRIAQLADGDEPRNRAEAAVLTHIFRDRSPVRDHRVDPIASEMAQIQLLADFDDPAMKMADRSVPDLAMRIEGHVRVLDSVRTDTLEHRRWGPAASQSPDDQADMYRDMERRDGISIFTTLSVMKDAREQEQTILTLASMDLVGEALDHNRGERPSERPSREELGRIMENADQAVRMNW